MFLKIRCNYQMHMLYYTLSIRIAPFFLRELNGTEEKWGKGVHSVRRESKFSLPNFDTLLFIEFIYKFALLPYFKSFINYSCIREINISCLLYYLNILFMAHRIRHFIWGQEKVNKRLIDGFTIIFA